MKSMRVFLQALMMFTVSMSALGDYVEIGTGTSANYFVPANGYWKYNWSQTVYLQSEIGGARSLGAISYYVNNAQPLLVMSNQRIYIKHTSLTQFPGSAYDDPVAAGFTLVYEGSVTWNGSGWHTITFNTGFNYNGSDNLIVLWENRKGSYVSTYPFFRYTTGTGRAKYQMDDNVFPMKSDGYGSLVAYYPNVRLHYNLPGPSNPQPANEALDIAVSAEPTLAWDNPTDAAYNALFFSTNETAVTATDGTARVRYDGATLWSDYQHDEALALGVTYYWRVLEYGADGFCATGQVWSFSTEYAPISSFPWSEGFELDSATLPAWRQEYVVGEHVWYLKTGGQSANPPSAHGGTYNVWFFNSTKGLKTRLITPTCDIRYGGMRLSFWHTQANWSGDQDELRVFYRTSPGGVWTLIPGAEYTANITAWTQRTLDLPEPSGTYWIAFEGTARDGYGVCVDDVEITPIPAAQGTPQWWLTKHGLTDGGALTFDEAEQRVGGPHGFAAWQEYVADTDPTNPASFFRMVSISNGPPVTVNFTPSSLARHYTLQYVDSLVGGTWSNVPGMGPRAGTGASDAMIDANAAGSRFYRVNVVLP